MISKTRKHTVVIQWPNLAWFNSNYYCLWIPNISSSVSLFGSQKEIFVQRIQNRLSLECENRSSINVNRKMYKIKKSLKLIKLILSIVAILVVRRFFPKWRYAFKSHHFIHSVDSKDRFNKKQTINNRLMNTVSSTKKQKQKKIRNLAIFFF